LWENEQYRKRLEPYGSRIYAFEHRSLTDSPITNALALVKTLPTDARLHLVSHSRGGMVGELLARANRIGADPFTDSEIEAFLERAKNAERKCFEQDAERLRELSRELRERRIRVERFVRVACPARGTTLASGRLDRWASVMLNLLGKGIGAAGKFVPVLAPTAAGYAVLKKFLLAVVRQRTDARVLPGLEAMMPDSPLVALLNAPEVEIEHPLHVLAGDFQGSGLLPWLGDCVSEVFYGGATDLVVNTPSMSGGANRRDGIWFKPLAGPEVYHFSYFERDDSALRLFDALEGRNEHFERLSGPSQAYIARGGKEPKRRADAPIAFLLPGIMGSHIRVGDNRIWFDPLSMIAGGMRRVKVGARGVDTDGWIDHSYEKLARHLASTHEVRPFVYDWRLSIVKAAEHFGDELDVAMKEARQRGKPLHLVAHSMGGLVARLALKDRWDEFKSIPGSRLLQLGTPNGGSHAMATVLLGRDDFVQMIERWFDWRHGMHDFLEIVREFPGVLELLPWPGDDGRAGDGVDYFDPATWQRWHEQDGDPRKDETWLPPQSTPLAAALAAVQAMMAAPVDPECSLYVAGSARTPVAVRVSDGRVQIGYTHRGDGRVPWESGIPRGVPVWYAESAHGDLAAHAKAFPAYVDLLTTGDTRSPWLARHPFAARGGDAPLFETRSLTGNALYPSAEELMAAALGGARPGRPARDKATESVTIEVIHGSLACAESPVLIGAYTDDSLRGSAGFLNRHLGDRLAQASALGRYPNRLDEALVVFHPEPPRKPAGAIVVGLGPLGELLPGQLTQTLTHGLLEYARVAGQCTEPAQQNQLDVSALLVGTGFGGLDIEAGVRCLLEALTRCNRALAQADMQPRIRRLNLFEEVENRAIAAVDSLRSLLSERRLREGFIFDGRLRDGSGGYRGHCVAASSNGGAHRVHVVADEDGGLRFTLVTERARNVVIIEPDQRQVVDGLIRAATGGTSDRPELSRSLFELMVPNGMKDAVADLRNLMLSLDHEAAAYPWELMRDADAIKEPPLATRVELIRQLASPRGEERVPAVEAGGVFLVGDTQSGMLELPGAQAEAHAVAEVFKENGYDTGCETLIRAEADQVINGLFNGRYRFMHLAGHGIVADDDERLFAKLRDVVAGLTPAQVLQLCRLEREGTTGMVLGPDVCLTSAQIAKLRYVPEFVFINCCHLGSMQPEVRPRWARLAANLATAFIEKGCKAVIAAGWAVDDQAASTFARAFYARMFEGRRFGAAVRLAREETHARHPHSNTWGAFQAYGDERYRFNAPKHGEHTPRDYVHRSHLLADLDLLTARLSGAAQNERKDYERQLEDIEAAARGEELRCAEVHERFAVAWAELNRKDRAIDHYRAALAQEDAGASLRALEQLANLEIRHGAELIGQGRQEEGTTHMEAGRQRLDGLLAIAESVERLSLLGSYWKRRAQTLHGAGSEINHCLNEMQQAYWQAAELAYRRSGMHDYYALLNALDGAFLCVARGRKAPSFADRLPELLQAVIADARRRYDGDRRFFHALAEVEAERIEAQWACRQAGAQTCIEREEVIERLAGRYLDLFERLGSARERDSTLTQLRFLVAMLPDKAPAKATQDALRQLVTRIGG
ncbi:MAG: CHAT domain-containing protein, partial [Chromatiales bacterium]|nr:CHAT domain-containing protein [Chromatiales bacterium]